MTTIVIPKSENPVVSIIIPVYNQLDYVLKCLTSIQNAKDDTPIEVILLDDCSPEAGLQETLSQLEGLIYVRNEENLRFVKNVNKGASLAKGSFIFLLNSDTEVMDNYLNELLKIFKNFDNVACVGSKLVYPDGRLQEAGTILYTDGDGYNYGNKANPDDFRYNFVRDVTHCSGAALLINKDVFMKLGMFDEDFTPGYYEDADFQFRARAKGYRVMYQPKSEVIHYEGMSHGKDPSQFKGISRYVNKILPKKHTGLKKYQEINKLKFLEKHKNEIDKFLYERNIDLDLQAFSKDKKQLYFFEDNLPDFDQSAGALRLLSILKILSEQFHVTLVTRNLSYNHKYYDEVTQAGIRVLINKNHSFSIDLIGFLRKYLKHASIIVISRPEVGAFFYPILDEILGQQNLNPYMIFDTVDLHFRRIGMQIESQPGLSKESIEYLTKSREYHRAIETFLIKNTDETWVAAEDEKIYLAENYFTDNSRVIPTIWNVSLTDKKYTERKNMLFIGGAGHQPNIDALEFYCDEIIPELKKRQIKIRLDVVGSKLELLPERIKSNEYINLIGFVDDPTDNFENALMAFYPLRFGAGMKGKVTQALAMGLPIVTTDVGAQGHNNAEDFMIIGNDVKSLVDAIEKYLKDPEIWEKNRKNGAEFLDENFSFKAVGKTIAELKKTLKL